MRFPCFNPDLLIHIAKSAYKSGDSLPSPDRGGRVNKIAGEVFDAAAALLSAGRAA